MRLLTAPRHLNLAGFTLCTLLLLTAYYFQYALDMEPCPLCMTQRLAFYACGLLFLGAAVHHPRLTGQRIYAGLTLLFSVFGAAVASRQLWLQSLPEDQVPACAPSLDYMLEVLPWADILSVMLRGSGDCAEVQWVFLGLSIPGWSLVAFVTLAIVSLILLRRRPIS